MFALCGRVFALGSYIKRGTLLLAAFNSCPPQFSLKRPPLPTLSVGVFLLEKKYMKVHQVETICICVNPGMYLFVCAFTSVCVCS